MVTGVRKLVTENRENVGARHALPLQKQEINKIIIHK
jgi:hypothetical protein